MKIDVGQEAMLRIVRANSYSTGVPFANLKIYVTHGGIERTRAGVRRRFISSRTRTCKEKHICRIPLKTRGVTPEHKDRPCRAKSDQTDSGPDVNRSADAITAGRDEQKTLIRLFLHSIDRLLQRGGIVCDSVTLH